MNIADDLYEAYNQGFDNGFEQGVSVTKAEYEGFVKVVRCEACELHKKCYFEDVFDWIDVTDKYCAVGKVKE